METMKEHATRARIERDKSIEAAQAAIVAAQLMYVAALWCHPATRASLSAK